MENKSLIKELLHRKVPQFVGLYIAAMWMSIEMGDWVIERFGLSADLTSYVFIFMLCLLPSVVYIAYQHGLPGRNPWHSRDFAIFPLNIAVSFIAVYMFVGNNPSQLRNEPIQIKNEAIEAAPAIKIFAATWSGTTTDNEWLSYAAPHLIANQLSPYDRVRTIKATTSNSIIAGLKRAGINNGINAPKALLWELARKGHATHALHGNLQVVSTNEIDASIEVYQLSSNTLVTKKSFKATELYNLVDQVTVFLEMEFDLKPSELSEARMPPADKYTTSYQSLEQYIKAKIEEKYSVNYEKAISHYKKAVELDPSFAIAYLGLGNAYYNTGKSKEQLAAIEQALQHKYKLDKESVYSMSFLKAMLQANKSTLKRTLDFWVEDFPNSIGVHNAFIQYYNLYGGNVDKILFHANKVIELDPSLHAMHSVIANQHVKLGDIEKAIEHQNEFLDHDPDNATALIQLSNLYRRAGNGHKAISILEKELLKGNIQVLAQLATNYVYDGKITQGEQLVKDYLKPNSPAPQAFLARQAALSISIDQGKLKQGFEELAEVKKIASKLMSPTMIKLSLSIHEIQLYLAALDYQAAIDLSERLATELPPPANVMFKLQPIEILLDQGRLTESENRLVSFQKEISDVQIPMLKMLLKSTEALRLRKEQKYSQSLALYDETIEDVKKSMINVQNIGFLAGFELRKIQLLKEMGRLEEAKALSSYYLNIMPYDGNLNIELLEILIMQNNFSEAVKIAKLLTSKWKDADDEFDAKNRLQNLLLKIPSVRKETTPLEDS